MLEVGLRVVRGKDWRWADQDGGEGHAGTVVEIGKPASTTPGGGGTAAVAGSNVNSLVDKTPDKTVIVQWDRGVRSNYRIGYQEAYDLLVFDNAAAGVRHPHIICDGCSVHGIIGIRWKCSQCSDYDLCTQCYMSDVHDLEHTFIRFITYKSVGVDLPPRKNCTKILLKGIFIGAKVMRGPDWEWGEQDGGRRKTGRVIDIRGWDNESCRSVATVTWVSGSTNVYRLGYKGCVDLSYVEEATAGTYYKEHLPHLGHPQNMQNKNVTGNTVNISNLPSPNHVQKFMVGDRVKVLIDIETLKGMQAGHGGWNPRMADYVGKIGTVHRVTDKGDIRIQYEGCNNRWTFHPGALTKIVSRESFKVGDVVRVKSDMNAVRHYQRGHGEWIDAMKVQRDVEVEKLLRDAVRGKAAIPAIKEFLRKHPGKVDARAGPSGGRKTCLQVAAHQGQRELCHLLLEAGASLTVTDDDGDTPLHYAAFGNQAEIMELLLSRGAVIDAVNNGLCSALHVAVNKQHPECVRTLLRHGCNVNLQDSYGDTGLHDSIGKESTEIFDALCSTTRFDYTLRNKRGFNVLHHAALKGNARATERLLMRARQLVDVKKEDGFAALHLASLNGHCDVAAKLLAENIGNAEVNLRNNRGQTPLHLAVSQGHLALVELLVARHKADIFCQDEDGDTPLHIAVTKCRQHSNSTIRHSLNPRVVPHLHQVYYEIVAQGSNMPASELLVICYFSSRDPTGNLLQLQNKDGESPLSLMLADQKLAPHADFVRAYKLRPREPLPSGRQDTIVVEMGGLHIADANCTGEVNQLGRNDAGGYATRLQGKRRAIDKMRLAIKFRIFFISIDSQLNEEELKKEIEKEKSKSRNSEMNDKFDRDKNLERLRYLETRIADLEDANNCGICMEKQRNVAFLCGHGACEKCAAPLTTCHMCRQTITKKINLY
ncbi:unnamed protein product [Trichogramma brassicae]|uniref:RING-type E3 ubiquitin transferase n=1 Tax=Trichogramma brassicae TaxID=86971 RepID=A0A6H5I036_9HYME|nr:unnamed protein product [Trichogramma brassicae]